MNVRVKAFAPVSALALTGAPCLAAGSDSDGDGWLDAFPLERLTLESTGDNPYFPLTPGAFVVLGEMERDGADYVLITVLDETEIVDGVETRVVEEREFRRGYLLEVSRNFFAQARETGDVYYFGEDVDDYEGGEIVGHSGAWRAGVDGAHAGLAMPAKPAPGMKYYLEVYPGVAMDRAEIAEIDARIETPAGTFEDCLVVTETNPLEPGQESYKRFAPGVGMIFDDGLELQKYGSRRRSERMVEFQITDGEMPKVPWEKVREVRPGGEMREIKVELHQDRVLYAVETFVEGQQYDVEVTEDGQVVRNSKD